jgi:hypothetical protein
MSGVERELRVHLQRGSSFRGTNRGVGDGKSLILLPIGSETPESWADVHVHCQK